MKTEVFIRSASCISPQQTFGADGIPDGINTYDGNKLTAIEPDYKTHLNIPSARRMSRLIKMGVCAALDALKKAGVEKPGAIIAGTGLGCMEDSEKFLASLIRNNEQTLSPTSFIFSTHNTVAAQIALLLQCNNYNFTHTHRGLSFENTLLDSILYLHDNPDVHVLAGASDEVTETSFKILKRLGGIKKENISSERLYDSASPGTIAGEGSAFFMLSRKPDTANLAKLIAVSAFTAADDSVILREVEKFRAENNMTASDFILTGINGDKKGDEVYQKILKEKFRGNPAGRYKHLCGEHHTSTAFACWIGSLILKQQHIPGSITHEGSIRAHAPERILIFNHYKGREYSFILLSKC